MHSETFLYLYKTCEKKTETVKRPRKSLFSHNEMCDVLGSKLIAHSFFFTFLRGVTYFVAVLQ